MTVKTLTPDARNLTPTGAEPRETFAALVERHAREHPRSAAACVAIAELGNARAWAETTRATVEQAGDRYDVPEWVLAVLDNIAEGARMASDRARQLLDRPASERPAHAGGIADGTLRLAPENVYQRAMRLDQALALVEDSARAALAADRNVRSALELVLRVAGDARKGGAR